MYVKLKMRVLYIVRYMGEGRKEGYKVNNLEIWLDEEVKRFNFLFNELIRDINMVILWCGGGKEINIFFYFEVLVMIFNFILILFVIVGFGRVVEVVGWLI